MDTTTASSTAAMADTLPSPVVADGRRRRLIASTPAPLTNPYGAAPVSFVAPPAVSSRQANTKGPESDAPGVASVGRRKPHVTATASASHTTRTSSGGPTATTHAAPLSSRATPKETSGGRVRAPPRPSPHFSANALAGTYGSKVPQASTASSSRRRHAPTTRLQHSGREHSHRSSPATSAARAGVGTLVTSPTPSSTSPEVSPGRAQLLLDSSSAQPNGSGNGAHERARNGGSAGLFSTPLPSSHDTPAPPCGLYDLHHALQHRLVEELGWSVHWYLDTETEIHQLELDKEVAEKARRRSRSSPPAPTGSGSTAACGSAETSTHAPQTRPRSVTPLDANDESGAAANAAPAAPAAEPALDLLSTSASVVKRHSDPSTPAHPQHRVDDRGRELPFATQKSNFGVVTNRFDCVVCQEIRAVARTAAKQTPRSRLGRSVLEYRLASLQRWLRKRGTESPQDALLAACLSDEAQRYLAYLGFADCWTSLFVTAGLPLITPAAGSGTATNEKGSVVPLPGGPSKFSTNEASAADGSQNARLCFAETLSDAAARLDRIPLSFYVLPALCRWKCMAPALRDHLLRGCTTHPFPLPAVYPSSTQSAAPSGIHGPLSFFTIQLRSHLPEKQRSSTRRNQMASLGESCVCDVYLVVSAPLAGNAGFSEEHTGHGKGNGAFELTTPPHAAVWGYAQRDGDGRSTGKRRNAPTAAAAGKALHTNTDSSGELFYIASSVENYLRLGLLFGWVYGWQMCFSSAGPPPNSVSWLRLVNASAYDAAIAANADTTP